jgi:lipoprotein signal peptidase
MQLGRFCCRFYFSFCNAIITGALANIINRLNTKGILVLVCISMLIVLDQFYKQYIQYRLKNGASSIKNAN